MESIMKQRSFTSFFRFSHRELSSRLQPTLERQQCSSRCTDSDHRRFVELLESPSYRRRQCEFCKRKNTREERVEFIILSPLHSFYSKIQIQKIPKSSYLNWFHYTWAESSKEIGFYLLEFVKSIVCPFFRHETIGSGDPFGGPHSNITVSPWATRVFCGSSRNSSRSTGEMEKWN